MSDAAIWLSQSQWKRLREQMVDPSVRRTRISFRHVPPRYLKRGDKLFVATSARLQGYAIIEEIVTLDGQEVKPKYMAFDKARTSGIRIRKRYLIGLKLKRYQPEIVFICRKPWIPCTAWNYDLAKPVRWPAFNSYRYHDFGAMDLVSYPFSHTQHDAILRKRRNRQVVAYTTTWKQRFRSSVGRAVPVHEGVALNRRLLSPKQRFLLAWGKGVYIPQVFPTTDGTIIALLNQGTCDVAQATNVVRVRAWIDTYKPSWQGFWAPGKPIRRKYPGIKHVNRMQKRPGVYDLDIGVHREPDRELDGYNKASKGCN